GGVLPIALVCCAVAPCLLALLLAREPRDA
ncbi:MAG: hypothetical protein QOJ63_2389, partial [Solirubrobacteraceae bacterium]|nr:hypothetical protein [Solirubrobacteraceae bacterium]